MSRWLPHEHRVLVRIDKVENITAGGIHLPGEAVIKEQNQQVMATVVDVGPTAVADADLVYPGARVLIAKWGGATIPDSDGLLRVINDEDINAILVSEET